MICPCSIKKSARTLDITGPVYAIRVNLSRVPGFGIVPDKPNFLVAFSHFSRIVLIDADLAL